MSKTKTLSFKKVRSAFNKAMVKIEKAGMTKEAEAIANMINHNTHSMKRLESEGLILQYVAENMCGYMPTADGKRIAVVKEGEVLGEGRTVKEASRNAFAKLANITEEEIKEVKSK